MVTFNIDGDAYSLLRDEAASLSTEAKAAIKSSIRATGETSRTVSCRVAIAREIDDWLKQGGNAYLWQASEEWKSPVCRRGREAIEAALSENRTPPPDSN